MFFFLLFCIGFIVTCLLLNRKPRGRAPERFCDSCYVLARPVQRRGDLFCSACGAPKPLPLMAPESQEFLKRRAQIRYGAVGIQPH